MDHFISVYSVAPKALEAVIGSKDRAKHDEILAAIPELREDEETAQVLLGLIERDFASDEAEDAPCSSTSSRRFAGPMRRAARWPGSKSTRSSFWKSGTSSGGRTGSSSAFRRRRGVRRRCDTGTATASGDTLQSHRGWISRNCAKRPKADMTTRSRSSSPC